MKPIYRWSIVIGLFVLAGLFADKGMELWTLGTAVNGAGIGVYFLMFEINDRVTEMNIPFYAIGFFLTSGTLLLTALAMLIAGQLKPKKRNDYKNA